MGKLLLARDYIERNNYVTRTIDAPLEGVIREALECGIDAIDIMVMSNAKHAFNDFKIATQNNIAFEIDDTLYTSRQNAFERSINLLRFATTVEEEQSAIQGIVECSIYMCPAKSSEVDLYTQIEQSTPEKFHVDIINGIKDKFKLMQQRVSHFHQFKYNQHEVTEIVVDMENTVLDLHDQEGIYILSGAPGSGKTSGCMRPTFDSAGRHGMYPIMISASRALAAGLYDGLDIRHYQNKHHYNDGVYGVALSMLLNEKFEDARQKCMVMLIDEFEDVIDQLHSKMALTPSLDKYIQRMDNLKGLIANCKVVVASDAFMSQYSFDFLAKIAHESGKRIYVCRQPKDKKKPKVSVTTKSKIVSEIGARAKNNKKSLLLSDEAHNLSYSNLDKTFGAIDTESKILIDAFKLSKAGGYDIVRTLVADHLVSVCSPVIKTGYSFLDKRLTFSAVISNKIISPNDILQFIHRARNVETAQIAFTSKLKTRYKNEEEILTRIVMDSLNSEFSIAKLNHYSQNETLNDMVKRLFLKNEMCINYEFTVLTMLEQRGYAISYDKEEVTCLNKNLRNVRLAVEKSRVNDIMQGVERYEFEADALKLFYQTDELTEELIRFDNKGNMRNVIVNNMALNSEMMNEQCNGNIQLSIIHSLGKEICIRDGFKYTNDEADKFLQWAENGQFKFGLEMLNVKDYLNSVLFKMPSANRIPIQYFEKFLEKNFGYVSNTIRQENYNPIGDNTKRSKRTVKEGKLPSQLKCWIEKLSES
ncbi:hypothetical protein ACLKQF_03630 [Aeromonas salmonicida]